MNLKEQTVFTLISDSIEKGTITYIEHFSDIENFRVVNVRYVYKTLKENQNQIILSKEELISLLEKTFKAGSDRNYHLNQGDSDETWSPNFGQYLSQLLDNQ